MREGKERAATLTSTRKLQNDSRNRLGFLRFVVIPFDDISSPDEFCKTDPASEFNRGPQRTQDSVNSIPHPKSLVGWLPDRWLAQRPIKKMTRLINAQG